MKRLYLTDKHKRFNQVRALEGIQRRQEQNRRRYRTVSKSEFVQKLVIVAPELFSIVDNTSTTLGFFNKLESIAYIYHRIYIDLEKVENITPETVLYLLLLVEKVTKNPKIRISGNAPASAKCRDIFINSGFYDFVYSSYKTNYNFNILSVKSENYVVGAIADEVIEFASVRLGLIRNKVTRAFYTTILECMGNTREHAYNSHDAKYAKWWLIAQYDKELCKIRFAILDNGKGIPETVRKKFIEKVIGHNDSDILKSVLNGEFRTSTELKYRGKGLPKIMFFKKENLIQDLVIIANNGYYSADNDRCVNIEPKFNGTMICWSFINGGCSEDIYS